MAALYLALVGLDACLYDVLPRLPVFSAKQRELLYSYGVFNPHTNPLYRQWLHGYVNQPGLPPKPGTADDAYRAYGIYLDPPPQLTVSGTDALGWWNPRMPEAAEVLFIGDSFCYGAGSGSEASIPALFEKATGRPVYAACKNGYGLPQYRDILDRLTTVVPAGSPERFSGKTVCILLYVGNDTSADLFVYQERLAEDRLGAGRHFELLSLRRLCRFLDDARAESGLAQAGAPKPSVDTHGYYPVPLTVPTQNGLPFAFHPFYRSFADMSWFGLNEEAAVRAALVDIRRLADAQGLHVVVAVVPTALQVLYPRIDWAAVDRRSEFAQKAADEARNLNAMSALVDQALTEAGLPFVDLERTFMDDPDAGLYYWPTDSHLTPAGNAAAVSALRRAFPELDASPGKVP